MKHSLAIGTALLAGASLVTPAAFAQSATPRPRARAAAAVSGPGYLGIGTQDLDEERAKALKLPEARGAEIRSVIEGSPAAKAGFKEGDVVLEYNGQRVEGIDQLTRLVGETPVGRQVKVQISRNGSPMTLTPTLEERHGMAMSGSWSMPEVRVPTMPNMPDMPPMPPVELPRFQMSYQNPMLGITGESLSQQEQFAEFLGVKDGVLVKSVTKDSAADKAGVKAGDVIVKVDESKVASTREITNVLRAVRSKKTFTLIVVRNKKEMSLTVTVEAASSGGGVRAMMNIGPLVIETPAITVSVPIVIGKPLNVKPLIYLPGIQILKLAPKNGII